ncbi:MAG: alpha-L-rhamnosidase N-terminal domain-containing protein [Clostridia bacterium]|nr:alpha-L-rhamnosidase N-terminal domain-containing protein [Clostridia bacterium]
MKKVIAVLLLLSLLLCSGCAPQKAATDFQNTYEIPKTVSSYARLDTAPKTDWKAQYIWDNSDGSEENVWMCLRKTVTLKKVPQTLNASISADSKYCLYINGRLAVFEGGVKRGPTESDSYYDTVDIAPYLKRGENLIAALVWYWGKDKSFSYQDSGKAGFLFEAGDILSDSSWKAQRHTAYQNSGKQPNYRLPEYSIYYDATKEPGDWTSPDFDDSAWQNATPGGTGGAAPWGTLYPRGIPLLKDYGLSDYENSADYCGKTLHFGKTVTVDIPYNAQCTPYFRIKAKAGKKIQITTENTSIGAPRDYYITKDGEQEFEALGWFNGEHIRYRFPAGVTILALKYRESGYDTAFSGNFRCEDTALNTLWQKSLRTLYVTMRDNYMDCPDRERAQWWGDVTNEMAMSMYSLDPSAYLLYQKGVQSMLGHVDPATDVLPTVVPISDAFFELPVQQLAGICGFWTYYLYTGDTEFIRTVYPAAVKYLNLWSVQSDGLVEHRSGSWDWMDWGSREDSIAIENAWYYYALSQVKEMAELLGETGAARENEAALKSLKAAYQSLWTESGYKSSDVSKPDDRANALAVLAGLADKEKYDTIKKVLTGTKNASPYMEYYVLEALCAMGEYDLARTRMTERYERMIKEDYSTLWEKWTKIGGTLNHAWSGGPLVIMSKYFAGVRPLEAGYTKFEIVPQPAGLTQIKCTVPSVKGHITVKEAQQSGGTFALSAAIPAGTTARIYLPYQSGQNVRCSGSTIYQSGKFLGARGITFGGTEGGFIIFEVSAPTARQVALETTAG